MISDIQFENKVTTNTQKTDRIFNRVIRSLFAIGVIGQWIFVYYIVAFYGGVVVNGTYEKINERLPHGIIEGDGMGNAMLAVHIFLAAIITFGGPIQFISAIRKRFPLFHRWNGRIYFVTAFTISFAGLYMIYTRGAHGGIAWIMGNTLNAALIMIFSVFAWRAAMKKNFSVHKKWAIRAFLMVSGVWFIRVGYSLWILLTGFTAPGTNESMTGVFDKFLSLSHSIIPLLVIEFYFFARAHSNPQVKKVASALFALLAVLLTAGVIMVTIVFWAPHF